MKLVTLLFLLILTSCLGIQSKYLYPQNRGSLHKNTFKVNAPFDEAWKSLKAYFPRRFFTLKEANKDTGLFTLSFGSGAPSRYVDCGRVYAENMRDKWPFIDVKTREGFVELLGTITMILKPIDNKRTSVYFKTDYVLNIKDGTSPMQTWNFDANGRDSKKFGEFEVTCVSTYYAENDIVGGINSVSMSH